MSFNFPNSPTEGTTYTPVGGYQYVWTDGKWRVVESPQVRATAETRSRIVNGAFQHSQENGTNPVAIAPGAYVLDQWLVNASTFVGAAVQGGAAPQVINMSITTGRTVAAGDYWHLVQPIEGTRIRDFFWGTANAKQIVCRFRAWASIPGTFTFHVHNGADDRSFLAPFTITVASTWQDFTIVVPGDTTGTWVVSTSKGMSIGFSLATGSTYYGVAGWQAGNKLALATQTNGAATSGTNYFFGDVGLYLDPDATGMAPKWTMPDEADELIACMRYWYANSYVIVNAAASAITTTLPTTMRVSPAVSGGGAGFSVANSSTPLTTFYQTTRANQSLVFNSRM